MLSFYPVDSLSEVMSRKRVVLVQLGVIVSSVGLVALSCGKIVHHIAAYVTMIALTPGLEEKGEGSRVPQLPLRA